MKNKVRKVKYARLQTVLYAPGVGELGSVLPHPSKTFDNFQMSSEAGSLMVSLNHKGNLWEIEIPKTNVVLMVLSPKEE